MLPEAREGFLSREKGDHDAALASFRTAYISAVELNNEVEACAAAHMIAVEIAELKGDVRETT